MFQSAEKTPTNLLKTSPPFPQLPLWMACRSEEQGNEIIKPKLCRDQTLNFHSSNNNLKINSVSVFEHSHNPCVVCRHRQCSGDCDHSWPSLLCHWCLCHLHCLCLFRCFECSFGPSKAQLSYLLRLVFCGFHGFCSASAGLGIVSHNQSWQSPLELYEIRMCLFSASCESPFKVFI